MTHALEPTDDQLLACCAADAWLSRMVTTPRPLVEWMAWFWHASGDLDLGRSALALAGPRWEHLWPVDHYKETPRAIQSLAWTNWPLFTVGMVQRGHSDDTIRKVLGENVLRVWRDNTPAKS